MAVRVFGSISEELMHKLDADAMHKNVSRSEWLRNAIEAYLQNGDASSDYAGDAELMQLRIKLEHYEDTINQKDQQITFLQGHVSQLTQSISQLALPQMTEEDRKKSWWQFWKGG